MAEQTIYYGAPGTGKSFLVKEKLKNISNNHIYRVTVHPEYTYSDFVGQLLPEENPVTGSIEFPFKPGPFTRALAKAFEDSNQQIYLIIEEMSRGNIAAILGDLFQLLDRDKYYVSKYPIRNKSISDQIVQLITDEIYLPANFNIIGTVNINDQNVFPMDTAFKRRFDWIYVSPDPATDVLGKVVTKLNNPLLKVTVNDNPHSTIEITWLAFYTSLNDFITNKNNGMAKAEDKQLGQFFIDFNSKLVIDSHSTIQNVKDTALQDVNEVIKNKLLLYLWQDVQGVNTYSISNRLFSNDINSFKELYNSYGLKKVFNDVFIDNYLKPNQAKYPY